MSSVETSAASSRSLVLNGSGFANNAFSKIGSVEFGSHRVGGAIRPSYGYSLGTGFAGGFQSHAGLGLGSGLGIGLGAGGSRFVSGLAVGGGSLGLGLASGGGGGRLGFGWSAGGGGGGAGGGGAGGRFGFGWAAGSGGGGAGGGFWAGGSSIADGGLHPFTTNEKLELQSLNDRLAIYLDKVKRLETANQELEEKLRGFKANKVQITYDMQAYQNIIQPLRDQLTDVIRECSRLALLIDNAKLTADDYRVRFENERVARQTVESDIAALKALKRDYELTSAGLMQEYDILVKDRSLLQTTHQQEVLSLRGKVAGTLTVNVQSGQSVDLSNRLAELRAEYEHIVEKNHREIENWYTAQLASKEEVTVHVTEVTVSGSAEIASNRSVILKMQTEMDAHLLQKNQLEQRLVDIQGQKQIQMLSLSRLAGGLEGELASMRESALQQARDYQLLLSTKVQLEREIATYKSLLEFAGDLTKFPGGSVPSSWLKSSSTVSMDLKSSSTVSVAGSVSGEAVVDGSVDAGASGSIGGGISVILDAVAPGSGIIITDEK